MFHESNLYHLLAFIAYFALLAGNAGNVRISKARMASTLVQLAVLILCVDLLIGFFAIEQIYGSSISAGWITKSIYGVPFLFLLSLAWMFRAHRAARRQHALAKDDV